MAKVNESGSAPLSVPDKDIGKSYYREGVDDYMVELLQDPKFEPVTAEDPDRVLFLMPNKNREEILAMFSNMESQDWNTDEAPMQDKDYTDWNTKMAEAERVFYKHIFGMFGPADEKIIRNIGERFTKEFEWKEINAFYIQQDRNELVHSGSYSKQIIHLFREEKEYKAMCDAGVSMPVVGDLMNWVDKWIGSNEPLPVRLAAFAFFEGAVFQGMFMSLQLLKERGLMPGITKNNEFIKRDEELHCDFASYLMLKYIRNRPEESEIHSIAGEVVVLVDSFFTSAINAAKKTAVGAVQTSISQEVLDKMPCPVPLITKQKMYEYVRYKIDIVCQKMGYNPIYRIQSPYGEEDKLLLNSVAKTNFFEDNPSQYNRNVDMKHPKLDTVTTLPKSIWVN